MILPSGGRGRRFDSGAAPFFWTGNVCKLSGENEIISWPLCSLVVRSLRNTGDLFENLFSNVPSFFAIMRLAKEVS